MLMLKSLSTWSDTTLRARARGITTLCVSGRRWSKKLRGEVKRSMLAIEKRSELQKGNPLRKFKGRTVFQGNNVKDENAEQALFAELGSAPSTMEAAKAIDAYGAMPGNCTQQSDGRQAYSIIQGNQDTGTPPKVSLAERLGLKV